MMNIFYWLLVLLLRVVSPIHGQISDTIQLSAASINYTDTAEPVAPQESAVYRTAQATVMLLFVFFMLLCIGAGMLLMGTLLGIAFICLSAGILSTSLVVWVKTKSAVKGAKTFLLLLAGAMGMPTGAAIFWLLSQILHWPVAANVALLLGAIGGLIAGLLTLWFAWWAGQRLLQLAYSKLRIT